MLHKQTGCSFILRRDSDASDCPCQWCFWKSTNEQERTPRGQEATGFHVSQGKSMLLVVWMPHDVLQYIKEDAMPCYVRTAPETKTKTWCHIMLCKDIWRTPQEAFRIGREKKLFRTPPKDRQVNSNRVCPIQLQEYRIPPAPLLVTKTVTWWYLGNQEWYHRSPGVKTTGKHF